MKCIICDGACSYYFSKTFTEQPYAEMMRQIGPAEYHKCQRCGFVLSKTHQELDDAAWSRLNHEFHHYYESLGVDKGGINQPPYAEQALLLVLLARNGIIDPGSMIDFAAGYGHLSDVLARYFDFTLRIYEPYIQDSNLARYVRKQELGTYRTVMNSAMFEHVLRRENLDQVNNLVAPDGCLIVHTVVCENIPRDPEWFYLRPPVHTAFHTNRSMGILMEQWNYKSSIYAPKAKSWVLLRDSVDRVEPVVRQLNRELQTDWFYCKNGFVDYWKGF